MDGQKVVDEVISMIALQAEAYRKRLDEHASRVEEYAELAKRSDLREAIEVIVEHGLEQEKIGVERDELINKVSFVLTLLFSDPLTGQVKIPLDFWRTPFGALINAANRRFIHSLITPMLNPSDAAREADVSRQTIYTWIEQGKLLPIWEYGHLFIIDDELQRVARKMKRETQAGEEHATVG
ncbi:MAG: helix-turn-helix domain-containing protein [Chloroflexi bacterium]|nr:helix-turn-helix domain-containing protein [Chloroflexota bacterium]